MGSQTAEAGQAIVSTLERGREGENEAQGLNLLVENDRGCDPLPR